MSEQTLKVVVLENLDDSVRMISKALNAYNFIVYRVHSSQECMTMLARIDASAIVLDLSKSQKDGWDILTQVRANPGTAKIPIIAITAFHATDANEDAALAPFNAHFHKPINPAALASEINRMIDVVSASQAYSKKG